MTIPPLSSLQYFTRHTRVSAALLATLLLAACGGPPSASTPATSTSSAAASAVAAASASAVPASAPPASSQSAEPSASGATEPSGQAPAASVPAASVPTLAVVGIDNTVSVVEGTERQTITTVEAAPACGDWNWSPDGYRLALENGVYTFGADLSTAPLLSPFLGSYHNWSPDSTQLAWLAGVDEHLDVIRVGGADGNDAQIVGGAHWGFTGRIDWSADGQLVAAGALQAAADGSGFAVVEGRGRNPTWALNGSQVAWTTMTLENAVADIAVAAQRGDAITTLAHLSLPLPAGNDELVLELERLPLSWLPDSSTLLISVPNSSLASGGTYAVRDGEAKLVSPHMLCDLSPDGQQMVARTADNQLVLTDLDLAQAEQTVVAELGAGLAAAWRPQPQGMPPAAPLAERSPQLKLATPRTQSNAVLELQQRLDEQGYAVGPVDGIFGEQTEQAVRAFQAAESLAVDGIVGPQTWAALRFDALRATKQFFEHQ